MKPLDKETIAYITQLTEDLRCFITEDGEILVVEKPIKKELKRMKRNEEDVEEVKDCTHLVEFTIKDQGAEIKLKGFGMSLEEAAKKAKDAAFKYLGEIQDEVVSNADRHNQVNAILNKTNTIH